MTSVVYGMDITLRNKIPEISPERWVYRITLNSVRKESRNSPIQPKNYFVSQVKKNLKLILYVDGFWPPHDFLVYQMVFGTTA